MFTFCVCCGGAQLFSLFSFFSMPSAGYSEWDTLSNGAVSVSDHPVQALTTKPFQLPTVLFSKGLRLYSACQGKQTVMDIFWPSNYVKRHCPPVFLFVTVLWHRKLWSGQSAKVQGSFRLLICFYLSKCSKISVSPHNNPLNCTELPS